MDKYSLYKKQLKQIVNADPNYPIIGTVKSIQGDTCTVEITEGFEVPDVRLKSLADESENILIVPTVGSKVMMLRSDETVDGLIVIKVNQASKIIYKENGLELEIDSKDGKISVKNESYSLLELFTDMIQVMKEFKVYTNTGPSGTALPDSMLSIQQLETNFKKLLK